MWSWIFRSLVIDGWLDWFLGLDMVLRMAELGKQVHVFPDALSPSNKTFLLFFPKYCSWLLPIILIINHQNQDLQQISLFLFLFVPSCYGFKLFSFSSFKPDYSFSGVNVDLPVFSHSRSICPILTNRSYIITFFNIDALSILCTGNFENCVVFFCKFLSLRISNFLRICFIHFVSNYSKY